MSGANRYPLRAGAALWGSPVPKKYETVPVWSPVWSPTILLVVVLAGCGAESLDRVLIKSYDFDRREKSRQQIQTLIPQASGEDLLNLHLRAAELCGGPESKRHYQAALALDPECKQALSGLACRDLFDDRSQAVEILQRWVDAEPDNGLPLYFLAYREVRKCLDKGKPSPAEAENVLRLTRKANETGIIAFHPVFVKLSRKPSVAFSANLLRQADAELAWIPMPRGAFRHLARELGDLVPEEPKNEAHRIMLDVATMGDNLALSNPPHSLMLLSAGAIWSASFDPYLSRNDLTEDERSQALTMQSSRVQAIQPYRQAVRSRKRESELEARLHEVVQKIAKITKRELSNNGVQPTK